MKCDKKYDFFSIIEEQSNKKLPDEIEEHLAGCEKCALQYKRVRLFLEKIDERKTIKANPFLYIRIKQSIENREKKQEVYSRIMKPILVTGIIVVALISGIAMGSFYKIPSNMANNTSSLYWNDTSQEPVETALLSDN